MLRVWYGYARILNKKTCLDAWILSLSLSFITSNMNS